MKRIFACASFGAVISFILFFIACGQTQKSTESSASPSSEQEFVEASSTEVPGESEGQFIITGILVGKDGSPIQNQHVYFFQVEDGKITLIRKQDKDGFLVPDHPSGLTDSSGRFTIKVSLEAVKDMEFTVGIAGTYGAMPLKNGEATVTFTQVKSPLNIGRITIEK